MEVLFCKIDGRVLGGMQFGALVEVLLCEIGGRALGRMQFRVLVEVLFGHAVWGARGDQHLDSQEFLFVTAKVLEGMLLCEIDDDFGVADVSMLLSTLPRCCLQHHDAACITSMYPYLYRSISLSIYLSTLSIFYLSFYLFVSLCIFLSIIMMLSAASWCCWNHCDAASGFAGVVAP